MKLKLLTAALVLATSGSAHALIVDGASDNGELFMTLWNMDAETSYILDLNLRMNEFLDKVRMGPTFSCMAGQCLYEYRADANMTMFLQGVTDLQKRRMVFAIGALDSVGATTTNFHRYISTASVIDTNSTLTNFNLRSLGASGNQFLANNNATIGDNASQIITDKSRVAYAGSAQWGHNWGGVANFTATGPMGGALDMYLVRQSSGAHPDRLNPSVYEALMYRGNPVFAQLDMDGNLYIAAVPEPETYALMLAGLGLVGWMARRRKAA